VIVRKSSAVPAFYEKFSNYGKNRLEWVNHLRFRGFQFRLLSFSWLFHLRHRSVVQTSYDPKKDNTASIFQILEWEHSEQYKDTWRIPLCNNMQESYSNPSGLTVDQFLEEKAKQEKEEKPDLSYIRESDRKIVEQFLKRRKQKKNKVKLQ
jgi:hypothetical protein